MTARHQHTALPPGALPRGLSRVQAAEYVGVSPSLFDEMVKDGRMPPPKTINSRVACMPGADRLAEHYIRAYGLCAVYVAASGDAGAPGIVGTTRSPRAREHRLRHDHGRRAGILRLWWCATEADARAVAEAARAAGGAGADDIPAVAAALGVALADPGTVADRAREAVEAVRARIEAMRATGGLRAVNADYKLMRQRRAAAGQATMPYPVYLRRRAIGMLYDMASEVRARAGRR